MRIGNGTHNRTNGQAVEIVIDEDQHTQQEGCDQRACLGFDVGFSPTTECLRTAGTVDQGNDDTQYNQEDEDTGAVSNSGDQTVIDDGIYRTTEIVSCVQQSTDQNTDEQRGVNLLGDQCQSNGNDRGKQCPCCLCSTAFASSEEGNNYNSKCCRENGSGNELARVFHKKPPKYFASIEKHRSANKKAFGTKMRRKRSETLFCFR